MDPSSFQTLGCYVPNALFHDVEEDLYESAGCLDLSTYFDTSAGSVPRGDPVAEVTAQWADMIVSEFSSLYESAAFDDAAETPHDEYALLVLAVAPRHVYALRDRFDAAALIQDCDTRVAHTAILSAAATRFPLSAIRGIE